MGNHQQWLPCGKSGKGQGRFTRAYSPRLHLRTDGGCKVEGMERKIPEKSITKKTPEVG